MAHWTTRSNLSAAIFPFATAWMGRSIIVPQFDQNYDRSVVSTTDADKDKGIPQAFYMHNVLPTAQGFQSIAYKKRVNAAPYYLPAVPQFGNAFLLRNSQEDRFLYSPKSITNAVLQNNIYDPYQGVWKAYNLPTPVAFPFVTTAYINNQTYIYVEGLGCYKYDKTVPGLVNVVLTSLVAGDIIGITSANGYMIAWTKTRVYWSSVVDPTDFTPSLVTGAGSGLVNDIKGPISFCLQISGGFVVYTERNAVGASYTGNIRYPFAFKEVVNSGGLHAIEDVVTDSSNAEHYALTTSGLQKIDRQSAVGVAPELTDFLTSTVFEDFNEATVTLTTEYLASPVVHKIALCANRYLVISYGKTSLTHALVMDLIQKRWGKLKIDHVDCFDFFTPEKFSSPIDDPIKGSVGFLQIDGEVYTVDFASGAAGSNGVLMLGKFQFLRNEMLQLNAFNWEAANPNGDFKAYVMNSLDGTNFQTPVLVPVWKSAGRLRQYLKRIIGQNISLIVVGSFNLVTNEIEFTKAGSR